MPYVTMNIIWDGMHTISKILIQTLLGIVQLSFQGVFQKYERQENILMPNDKRSKKTKDKKEDGAFPSKNIKHDPQAESARAKFGKDTPAEE